MTALVTLARALVDGGAVVWPSTDRPRIRVASRWATVLREQPEPARAELREMLRRASIFRLQIAATKGTPVIPLLTLPDVPEIRSGACISCGDSIPSGWRCGACRMAVSIALGDMGRLAEIADAA